MEVEELMEEVNVTVTINGKKRSAKVEPRMLLTHFIRDSLSLTARILVATRVNVDLARSWSMVM